MNAKKRIALLLAVVLCIGTLAACNADPAETTAPPADTTAPAADTTAPAADTTEATPMTNAERYPIDFDGTLTCVTGRETASESAYWVAWEEHTGLHGICVQKPVTNACTVQFITLSTSDLTGKAR